MKRQADKKSKKSEIWKVGDQVMLSTKDLVFKEQLAKRLVDQYVSLYIINEVVFQLSISIRIYPVVNISQVV